MTNDTGGASTYDAAPGFCMRARLAAFVYSLIGFLVVVGFAVALLDIAGAFSA